MELFHGRYCGMSRQEKKMFTHSKQGRAEETAGSGWKSKYFICFYYTEKLEAQHVVNVCSHNVLFSCGVSPHILSSGCIKYIFTN